MNNYIKNSLKSFVAYIPGEQPQKSGWIKLNTNENPYPPSPKVVKALQRAASDPLNLYPDPVCLELRKTISRLYKVHVDQIFVGNGSDEVLRVILGTFLNKGEKVLFPYPSYPLYQVLAEIQSGTTQQIPLTDDYDLPDWKKEWQGKILFIANPNSPTGGLFSNKKISQICNNFKGLVVLDEAYVDFADSSGLPLLSKHKNIIVSRTVSKSYSLAGMRVGFALASKEIISSLYLVKDSYNVNRLSQVAAKAALEDRTYFQKSRALIIKTRIRLIKELDNLGFHTYHSDANFIFTSPPNKDGKALYQVLKNKKILVRYWDKPRLRHAVRITIGTDKEINRLIGEIRRWING